MKLWKRLWKGSRRAAGAPAEAPTGLEARVQALESSHNLLRVEWQNVLEQMERLAGRAARDKALARGAQPEDGNSPAGSTESSETRTLPASPAPAGARPFTRHDLHAQFVRQGRM